MIEENMSSHSTETSTKTIDDFFNSLSKEEIEEWGKEYEADSILSTIEYHSNN